MKKDESWFEEEYFCYECGSKMEKTDEIDSEILVCPNCQHSIDIDDYLVEEEIHENYYNNKEIEEIPDMCDECGGPWPECQSGCRLFRD